MCSPWRVAALAGVTTGTITSAIAHMANVETIANLLMGFF
jgi:hypothetical protein